MSGDLTGEIKGLECKLKSIADAKEFLLSKCSKRPEIGIVCGTGLGGLADTLQDTEIFQYGDIPHFPTSSVPGHAGKLVFGVLEGKEVVCMQGRIHAYEGHDLWKVTFGIRVFSAIGVKVVIMTNASGGVNRELKEGDVVILKDHINIPGMAGFNPLIGLNDTRFGPRFQETTSAYDRPLQEMALDTAKVLHMDFVKSGVYCYQFGPAYESPAEIRFLLNIGADVVGMSTVPEVLAARHCGMKCLGISLVTNICVMDYHTGQKPCHEEVLELGARRANDLLKFISLIVTSIK